MTARPFQFLTAVLFILTLINCKKSSDESTADGSDSAASVSESAMAQAAQQATATEGASAPMFAMSESLEDELQTFDILDPKDFIAKSACSFSAARSTCSGNVSTITWNGCTVGSASLSGGWTETWSAGFCASGSSPGALTHGTSVTRTTEGEVLTLASGIRVTTETSAHTTYDGTSIPSTGVSIANSSGTRTVTIHGLHRVMTGPRGRTLFDHSITGSLTLTGTRASANRVVSGTSTLFHNLAGFRAAHTFNNVTWGQSSCCYPTSGSITSVLSGSRTGNVTLTFSNTCGQATFSDADSTSSQVALSQCQ